MLTDIIWGYSIYDLSYFFVIYAFLGWLLESQYAWIEEGHFVNRGFLNGPFCPIYGFGSLLLIVLLQPLLENLIFLFMGAVIITSVLEYCTGWILEKLFHEKWWDYSRRHFNLQGRICLQFSIYWGIGAVAMLRLIHPQVSHLVGKIPVVTGNIFLAALAIYFAADFVHSVRSTLELKPLLIQVAFLRLEAYETMELIRDLSMEAAEQLSEDIRLRYEEILHRATAGTRRLFKAFPDLGARQHENMFRDFRDRLKHRFGNNHSQAGPS